ncbi:MAG: AMP-binding protein, partial [Alphaproteobacteria bacterium]|nr:AMP-binding protein [Alphaproteobacteria bacterium]
YGLSESSPVATVNPPFGENVPGSIGLPLPGTVIEIINPDDKVTPMKLGERGEVCIRGPQVMKGYWEKPEATAEVLRETPEGDMRLYTADIGIMNEDGYVRIVDRIKDMIIVSGFKVYPRNIEEQIYQYPCIEECVVAGVYDQEKGEVPKVWIKCKDGMSMTTRELQDFLSSRLSKLEMPKHVEFSSTPLPKTMIGKLDRKALLAQEPKRLPDFEPS